MSALPPKADVRGTRSKSPLSANLRHALPRSTPEAVQTQTLIPGRQMSAYVTVAGPLPEGVHVAYAPRLVVRVKSPDNGR